MGARFEIGVGIECGLRASASSSASVREEREASGTRGSRERCRASASPSRHSHSDSASRSHPPLALKLVTPHSTRLSRLNRSASLTSIGTSSLQTALSPTPRALQCSPPNVSDPRYYHKVVDCQWACPAHTNVPEYLRLIAQGRYTDSYLLNRESNVFPGHPRPHLRPAVRAGLPPRTRGRKAGRDLPAQARRGRPARRRQRPAPDGARRQRTASASR